MTCVAGREFLVVSMVAAVLVATIGSARADDVDALIKKGVEFRRLGKEQEALETFQRAAQIRRTPRAVAQVALAEQALGLWPSAERDLKEALDGADRDAWIAKNRRQLDDAFRVIQGHLGSLEVLGTPAEAEVLADGEVVGRLPISKPIRLPIGEIALTVRKNGYDKVTRMVSISKGDLVRENIALHRAPTPVAAKMAPPIALDPTPKETGGGGEPSPGQLTLKAMPTQETQAGPRSPIYGRWWFWTAVGVVALGAGAGAYLLTRPHCTRSGCDDWSAQ